MTTTTSPGSSASPPAPTAPATSGPPEFAGPPAGVAAGPPRGRSGRITRLWRGRDDDPRWVRPAVWLLLAATAVLYLWNISVSGWANSFYSAAAQAGTESWKAFFFGSSDAANFITVDKTPGFLWVIEIFTRIFGLHYWTVLAPQALEGVASVGLLYATVRRWSGPVAGLIAGAVLALTPVATLMFRFNNPDALLVLLLIAAVWATQRALEVASTRAGTRWLMLAGVFIGFGFLTKMLQALLIVPVLGLVYLVVADTPVKRRIFQLLAALGAMIVSAGWWIAIVELWPASSRPYIGGSQNNSIFDLMFGYNGFGRLSGNETGSVVPGGAANGGGAGAWGATGITRLFGSEMGTQASWLIPAALILAIAAIAFIGKALRTDLVRAALLLWGGWLVVTGLVFSFGQGIIHPYYTVALAPAIGACVGIGAVEVWKRRGEDAGRAVLAIATAATAIWCFELLGRSTWQPWLRWVVLLAGLAAAIGLAFTPRMGRRLALGMAAVAVVIGVAAPAAYAVETATESHSGAIPSAGPTGGFGGGRGNFRGNGGTGQFGGGTGNGNQAPGFGQNGTGQNGTGQNGTGQNGTGQNGTGQNGTGQNGTGQNGTGTGPQGGFGNQGGTGQNGTGQNGTGPQGGLTGGGNRTRGGGGFLNGTTPSAQLTTLLKQNADQYTWVAAAVTSNGASGYQLATGKPVMAIGGYNGTDPTPTLAQFEAYVKAGKIHYFIASGGMGFGGGTSSSGTASQITAWVEQNFKSTTVSGTTVYDLTTSGTGTVPS